ncbi:TPA: helix-turn-helix domain-containing protein [Citrobacter braakii]
MMKPNDEMKLIISKWLLSGAARVIIKSEVGIERTLSVKPNNTDYVFLTEGAMDIRRTMDDLVFCTALAPYIMSGTDHPGNISYFYGEIRAHSIAYRIKKETALSIVEKNNLFRELWMVEKYKSEAIWRRDANLNGASVKVATGELITVLSMLPPEFRRSISVYKFLQERTKYSKSTIMRVVNYYRQNGQLEVKNGIIIGWSPKEKG